MRTPLVEHEYYHIYNRGNGKHSIFTCEEDYERFMKLLYVCNSEKKFVFRDSIVDQGIDAWDFETGDALVEIVAWVLMPNHFHILLCSHRSDLWEKGYNPITEFMRKLGTAYAMFFNKTHQRAGSLFEGKFKSLHVDKNNYFHYLFSYIHLNPIKLIQSDWREVGIKNKDNTLEYLSGFYYSSFVDFFAEKSRKEKKILSQKALPENFRVSHYNELFAWIRNFP